MGLLLDMAVLAEQTGPAVTGGTFGGLDLRVIAYAVFIGLVLVFLALDLGVFHKHAHEVSMREAITWSAIWIAVGLSFAGLVYGAYENRWLGLGGPDTRVYNTPEAVEAGEPLIVSREVPGLEAAEQYLVGYIVEKSLALDNIFVIALVFGSLAIPGRYQHRVLFWGILGALVMRGGMIFLGAGMIMKFQWILIIFGAFLLLTAVKMAILKESGDPSQSFIIRLARRVLPVVPFFDGQKLLTRRTVAPTYSTDPATGRMVQDPPPPGTLGVRWAMTPLMLALIMVEFTDLIFAVDSIPAIFAITPDPFIVLTSNILAILGLRSLYFCLASMIGKFRYLKPALIAILAFVGVKLLLLSVPPYLDTFGGWFSQDWPEQAPIKISAGVSLAVVTGLLVAGVVASLVTSSKSRVQTR
ncbi:MAG: hypothetical protein GIKADHBN_02077 [Phycisphaerales bacterium]|nr:hypothetical protein [Phycisphaerales bacterium]